jgi:hypothetical protein
MGNGRSARLSPSRGADCVCEDAVNGERGASEWSLLFVAHWVWSGVHVGVLRWACSAVKKRQRSVFRAAREQGAEGRQRGLTCHG